MTGAEVSLVATLGRNIVEAEAVENEAACLRLLTDAEYLCHYGDAAVVPTEFDGIFPQIIAGVADGTIPDENIIDLDGAALDNIADFNRASAQIAGRGQFGAGTDLLCSFAVQTDLDNNLDPAARYSLTNSPQDFVYGATVRAIKTSFGRGKVEVNPNTFINDEQHMVPFQLRENGDYASVAVANAALAPAAVTAAAAANEATSRFNAPRAGAYFYHVAGLNERGESTVVTTAQVTVAAGGRITLTIQPSAGGQETGYAIYRSRQNGTNAPADARLIKRVPKAGSGNTTFVDVNREIPGATMAAMVNMAPGADNIAWRQLLPMTKFPFFPTQRVTKPWAQLLFGYLRITKLRQNVLFRNIVPTASAWKPFA